MTEFVTPGRILAFDEEKREVEMLLMPWDAEAEQADGFHRFERGAFAEVDPKRFVSRMRHQDPPTGRGFKLEEQEDGPHLWVKVSKTQAGDEQLTLIRDGVEDGVSIGFDTSDHRKEVLKNGKTRYTHTGFSKARSLEASTTWQPAFGAGARVLQVMEASTVSDEAQAQAGEQAASPQLTEAQLQAMTRDWETNVLKAYEANVASKFEALQDRIAGLGMTVPDSVKREAEGTDRRIALSQAFTADADIRHAFAVPAEVVSSDNLGVIPEMRSSTIIGIIDSSRPFLEATTRDATPPAGETWKFPKITQRPAVAVQAAEKDELATQATAITTVDFPMATYGGVGDLSMQLIKRSSPSFLDLWLRLLGEQYAIATDNAAVDDLLSETAVVEGTGTFDPSAPAFGESFSNAATAALGRPGLLPNRIFLSTAALVAFIDAKSPAGGGGTPMYPGLARISGISGDGDGAGPAGFAMQPVWVPALDDEAVDIIIGPSQGFHWTEDGTYTLQADIPSKFGRDVGLAGMIWFAPVYPAAFTTYVLAS